MNEWGLLLRGWDLGDVEFLIAESDLATAHQWAEKAGLHVVACISAESTAGERENAEEVVSFSNHMGLNASWQLGYGNLKIIELWAGYSMDWPDEIVLNWILQSSKAGSILQQRI